MPTDAWPDDRDALAELQTNLAAEADTVPVWIPQESYRVAAVFVAGEGDELFAAATLFEGSLKAAETVVVGRSTHPYVPGLLALREGPTLERSLRALDVEPDVVVVNATGRDHPRGAGLALHLGAVIDVPTIGVTDRPLVAEGRMPASNRGATAPLMIEGALVGYRLRTRTGVRPVCVHAAWRTDAGTACEVVRRIAGRARTPRPLREARRLAREARARATR